MRRRLREAKVVILDKRTLTSEASNALLKTLRNRGPRDLCDGHTQPEDLVDTIPVEVTTLSFSRR